MSYQQNPPPLVYGNIPQYVAGPPPPAPPSLPMVYMPSHVGGPVAVQQAPQMNHHMAQPMVPGQYVLVQSQSPDQMHQSHTPPQAQYVQMMQQQQTVVAPNGVMMATSPTMQQQHPGAPLQSLFTVHNSADAVTVAMHSLNNSIDVRSASVDQRTPSMSASAGHRDGLMMRSTDSRSSVNSETPCRHFMEGKCNRRKCRFKHDPDATIESTSSPSNSTSANLAVAH